MHIYSKIYGHSTQNIMKISETTKLTPLDGPSVAPQHQQGRGERAEHTQPHVLPPDGQPRALQHPLHVDAGEGGGEAHGEDGGKAQSGPLGGGELRGAALRRFVLQLHECHADGQHQQRGPLANGKRAAHEARQKRAVVRMRAWYTT